MAEMTLDIVRLLLFPALMAFAAISDLFTMTISNRISLLLVAGFVLLAAFGGMSLQAISLHVAAGFAVLTFAFVCFALGWVGGGDAKLVAATALWFGFDHLMMYLVYASIAGGVLTLLILQLRQWPLPAAAAVAGLAAKAARPEDRRSLRHRARLRRAADLPRDRVDEGDRSRPLRRRLAHDPEKLPRRDRGGFRQDHAQTTMALARAGNPEFAALDLSKKLSLTRFRYASLTML